MRQTLLAIAAVCAMASCQKQVIPAPKPITNPPVTQLPAVAEPIDSFAYCSPFLQRVKLKIDATHADSAMLQLPCAYNSANKQERWPMLVFFNGVYEGSKYGNLNKMKKLGPPKNMVDSLRYTFKVNGKTENLIVVCPQSYNGYRGPASVDGVLNYMIKHYNIDTNRIYLTGLSAGAQSALRYVTDNPLFARRIAAIVPMSITHLDSTHKAHLNYITNAKIPLNWFCGTQDKQYLPVNKEYVGILNNLLPGTVIFRTYNGAHKGWNPMYSTSHQYYNPNIYEWMLQQKRP